ncbi:MAG: hypothetical protein LDL25_01925 [Hyphomicrobiales bacterium]|nr:hypothetical protein [Hyphomicrobiales bacterium]
MTVPARPLPAARAPLPRLALAVALALGASALPFRIDLSGGIALAPLVAAARENVSIDKIEIDTKAGKVVLGDLRVTGSSLARGEIEAIFRAASARDLGDRLAKFDAESLRIGTIRWLQDNESFSGETVYENVEARGIRAGAIGRLEIAGAKGNSVMKLGKQKDKPTRVALGRMAIDAFDLTAVARWITDADPTGKAPMKALHGPYSIESMEITGPEITMRANRTTVSGIKARLPRKPIVDMINVLGELAKQEGKEKPQLSIAALAEIIDVWTSFEMGEGRIEGIAFGGKDEKGNAFAATIGPVTFAGGAKAGGGTEAIDIRAADGFFKIKSSRFEGDGYAALFAGLAKAALAGEQGQKASLDERTRLETALKDLVLRDLVFAIGGIEADLPDTKAKSERVKFTLAGFEMRAGSFVGAIPTAIGLKLANFRMPVPANSKDDGIRTLREIGLDTLDLTTGIDARWDESKKTLAINDVSVNIAQLAKLALKAELGNIERKLFEDPQANWALAMMSGTIRSANVALENGGGLDKLVAKTAKDQKKTPDQLRVEMQTMGPAIIGAFLSNHPDAAKLAEALGSFLKTLGALNLTARAANGDGLTFTDFATASGNPAAILSKIRFDVSAR